MSDRRSLKYFALNGSCFSVVNKCIYYILLLIFILSGVLHEGPDSLNLVIKTWYYVSWGSNKYHQLYPVLIEQNKNLIKLFSAQLAGILFWTLALSPVHWYSSGCYQLQIWVFSIKRFSRIVPKLKPENINIS